MNELFYWENQRNLSDSGSATCRILEFQRAEVASLENSVETYRGLLVKYERMLADARARLARSEDCVK